jgi:hypothetical protein
MRGADTGEKAGSHPTGIAAGICSRRCDRTSFRDTAELISDGNGSRSPLYSRFTEKVGVSPAPAVCSTLKNGISPTKNRASDVTPNAPAKRTNKNLVIGLLRGAGVIGFTIKQTRQNPPTRLHRGTNACRGNQFLEPRSSLSRDVCSHLSDEQWLAPGTNLTVTVCHGGRPLFTPSPRAWPAMLGAADMPIGCALIFAFRQ